MSTAILEVRDLHKRFGGLSVARGIEFDLGPGARNALIGPNGAGKTTFVNLITGALRPDAGRVLLDGDDVTSLSQAGRVKRGIVRTFQITSIFKGLTVLENVCMAVQERQGLAGALWRSFGTNRAVIEEAMDLLAGLGLTEHALGAAQELSYGRQHLLDIAIALALKPKVLLLDEPAAGVPSAEYDILLGVIGDLPKDIAVLIIEHDMDLVFRFAQRITVLVDGAVFAEGTPDEIAAHAGVRSVYLGGEHHG
jgi:ABC-type branched-subunit amino acid transport system ATPase component